MTSHGSGGTGLGLEPTVLRSSPRTPTSTHTPGNSVSHPWGHTRPPPQTAPARPADMEARSLLLPVPWSTALPPPPGPSHTRAGRGLPGHRQPPGELPRGTAGDPPSPARQTRHLSLKETALLGSCPLTASRRKCQDFPERHLELTHPQPFKAARTGISFSPSIPLLGNVSPGKIWTGEQGCGSKDAENSKEPRPVQRAPNRKDSSACGVQA